ncbi:MAG TPA: 5'-methylthioadenosine/S-adenosylhomocysteine nucleosidase [Kofleriaceae bacterium]|nr:5'-methylthioadenosine/S-adenosylhomocysteine nucleosidase [Kofleriaceae bacterium]
MKYALVMLAACASSATQAWHPHVAAIVSANAEWTAVRAHFPDAAVHTSPYGEWFEQRAQGVIFFHGGWGKIAAAGSAEYVIEHFAPDLLVNLGTCGGFGAGVKPGEIILVDQVIVYDIVERMGDPDEAIRDYTTKLDVAKWPARLRGRVRVGHLASGDRDLDPADLDRLRDHFHAIAGDWESGAIAWVAARNHVPVLVLRGVSDVVDARQGDATYGAPGEFEARAKTTMDALLALFVDALTELS